MPEILDIAGASGALYRFRRYAPGDPLPAMAGAFIYVRQEAGRPIVVCCEAVDSLRAALDRWDEAQAEQGASDLYLRLNVGRAARRLEWEDIVEAVRPPMTRLDHP